MVLNWPIRPHSKRGLWGFLVANMRRSGKQPKEILDMGVIRRPSIPWASVVVLVRQKNRSLRFSLDLRRLNLRMMKDAYSLPRIDVTLDGLNGAK